MKKKLFHFVRVMLGPYIKSRGTGAPKCQQMQTSSHWRYVYNNKGKQLTTSISYMGQNMKINVHFWLFGGPGEAYNDQTGPILLSNYPLAYIYVHVK